MFEEISKIIICFDVDGKGKDSLIDLEDSSETNDKISSKFSGLCKFFSFNVYVN